MRYYLIAGEASGDLHGSNLIKGLRAEDPDARFRFRGGDLMLAAAVGDAPADATADSPLVRHYKDGAVMGIGDVIAKAGSLLGDIAACKEDILSWSPDVVILIDYPGFNMKIARFCHERGIRVFYYIAPKTWASRSGRNRKLKAWVDRLFIVFPFEIPYFTKEGIPFIYKGNPLVDAVADSPAMQRPRADFLSANGLPEGRYIAILAGSRGGEIRRMMPVCMDAVRLLGADEAFRDFRFVIAGAPSRDVSDYVIDEDLKGKVSVVFGDTYGVLRHAEAAVINSGTASLEAALVGTPQVVCWSTGAFAAFIGRNVLRIFDHVKYISLGNLCLDRLVFRELIQEDFTAPAVADEVRRLVADIPYREKMLSGYAEIKESLGGRGASRAVAASMIQTLKEIS